MIRKLIYLNHAGTSFPKPSSIQQAIKVALNTSPTILNKRFSDRLRDMQHFFRVSTEHNNMTVTPSCTNALRVALDHMNAANEMTEVTNETNVTKVKSHTTTILTSSFEHQALDRLLERLQSDQSDQGKNIRIIRVPPSSTSAFPLDNILSLIHDKTLNVSLIAFSHASNVTGDVLLEDSEIEELTRQCRLQSPCVSTLVDGAQTVGVFDIDLEKLGVDYFAFGGHKNLNSCAGVGGLYIRSGQDQPVSYCDIGSVNMAGLAGMTTSMKTIMIDRNDDCEDDNDVDHIDHNNSNNSNNNNLAQQFVNSMTALKGVQVHGRQWFSKRSTTRAVSLTVDGMLSEDVSSVLLDQYDIVVSAGLQCAPKAHETLGTIENGGTVRFSFGWDNTKEEMEAAVEAMAEIAAIAAT